jgi:hypothetical protein
LQNFACNEKITIFLLDFFLKWKFQNLCYSKKNLQYVNLQKWNDVG